VAAGVIEGDTVPAQALWRLGGPSSLRGYATASLIGERFWRTRTELGLDAGTTRISVFHDAAKASRRALFGSTDAQASFGIGLTQLGGLIRLDLARPIHGPRDWRLHLLVNRSF
jgi:hemolysin activation/secretion protein